MTSPGGQDDSNAFGLGLGGLIVLLFVSLGLCSKKDSPVSQPGNYENLEEAAANLDAAVELNAPLPLDKSAAIRGGSQLRLIGSDSPGSLQIFSQNCYDVLAKSFDWHQLDRCGGFDAAAVRWADEGGALTAEELEYFGPEAAATRFLTSATANGLAGGDADQRWEGVKIAVRRLPMPKLVATGEMGVDANAVGDVGDGDGGNDAGGDPLAPAGAPQL